MDFWTKDRILSEGSFGTVTLWRNAEKSDETVVTKICKWVSHPELTPFMKRRWSKEVMKMSAMICPNIVRTKKLPPYFEDSRFPYNPSNLPILCMEYCSGGHLRQVLSRPESCCGLPEVQVRHILNDIGNAIEYLHGFQITHCGLKPENIVLQKGYSAENNPGLSQKHSYVYKLIDFGFAKEMDRQSQYISPELLLRKPHSERADYWSFGVLAFEIICGVRPFLPTYPTEIRTQEIERKSSNTICIFENESENIEHSSHLFPENHISSVFAHYLEEWMRAALEWNQKKRGYSTLPKPEFGIIIFDFLNRVIVKKIITIFSVYTYSVVSYEIDDKVLISTVQEWIKRDLEIKLSDQLLIPLDGSVAKDDDLASKYYNIDSKIMFFLYITSKVMLDVINLKMSDKFKLFLAKRHFPRSGNNRVNLYKNVYYFIQIENLLFDNFSLAFDTLGKHLIYKYNNLSITSDGTHNEFQSLIAQRDLLSNIVQYDSSKLMKLHENIINSNPNIMLCQIWVTSAEEILEQVEKVKGKWRDFVLRVKSFATELRQCNGNDVYETLLSGPKSIMNGIPNRALAAYTNAHEILISTQGIIPDCDEAYKLSHICTFARYKYVPLLCRHSIVTALFDLNNKIEPLFDELKSIPMPIKINKDNIAELIKNKLQVYWQFMETDIEAPWPDIPVEDILSNIEMEYMEQVARPSNLILNSTDPFLNSTFLG